MSEESDKRKIVVLTSGGLDSSTTMLKLANESYEVHPLFIDYDQDGLFMYA